MRWTDIDFANKTIRFPELKNSGSGGGPIPDELLELLKEFKDGGYGGEIYVFRSRQGEPISASRLKAIISALFNGHSEHKEYNTHDMRTTVATEISRSPRCNTRTVQEVLGHKLAETSVGYERADSEVLTKVARERFNVVSIRPSLSAVEAENPKESKDRDLKPAYALPADVYLRQNLDVNHMLTVPAKAFTGIKKCFKK